MDYSNYLSSSDHLLQETELRLGLPGTEPMEKKMSVISNLGLAKNLFSGEKRAFSDAIGRNGDWVFSDVADSDAVLGKGGDLFPSLKGESSRPAVKGSRENASKAQVVGWPPIRNYRRHTMAVKTSEDKGNAENEHYPGCMFVKVSMDGAPYLRKVDLNNYSNYKNLSSELQDMFRRFLARQFRTSTKEGSLESLMTDVHSSDYMLAYEDKDGDWMLVGDVPWGMFIETCKRLKIMKRTLK